MDTKIKNAIEVSLKRFGNVTKTNVEEFRAEIERSFDSESSFVEKLDEMDASFDNYPQMEILREVFFDLLLINFFSEDVKKLEEDYLESEEWERIEEDTIDRGTELLNLLLYLRECADEDIDPSLEDYLKEFLLVDEDEFQDEHRIYEDIIANQILVESSFEEIAKVARSLPESSEIKQLFYPIMGFFHEQNPTDIVFDRYVQNAVELELDSAVYSILVAYNQSK